VPVSELVDMTLVVRLRPAALIVPPRHVRVAQVGDLLDRAVLDPVQRATPPVDDRDERRLPERHRCDERYEVELIVDVRRVADRRRQRQDLPQATCRRGEERQSADALTIELAVHEAVDPLHVGVETGAILVREPVPRGTHGREQRGRPRHDVAPVQRGSRVQLDVEADCGPNGRVHPGQRAEQLPRDPRHSQCVPVSARVANVRNTDALRIVK
jgi:hypothetical protein